MDLDYTDFCDAIRDLYEEWECGDFGLDELNEKVMIKVGEIANVESWIG